MDMVLLYHKTNSSVFGEETVVEALFMAPIVGVVNSSNVVHAHDGRDQSGPYDGLFAEHWQTSRVIH